MRYYVVQPRKKKVTTVILARTIHEYRQGCSHHRTTHKHAGAVTTSPKNQTHHPREQSPPILLNRTYCMKLILQIFSLVPHLETFLISCTVRVFKDNNFVVHGEMCKFGDTNVTDNEYSFNRLNFFGSSGRVLCYQTAQP